MVSSSSVAEHVRSVHAVISRPQRPSGHELVARSWLRCFHELGLDPAADDSPPPLAPQAWRERGDHLGEVMDSAMPEMQTLHRQLDDPQSALVLADADGVIVSVVRHHGFAREASLRGLVEGARWVRIHGHDVRVNAFRHTVGGLSAHADQRALLEWYAGFAPSPPLALVHGEDIAREALAGEINERHGVQAVLTRPGMTLEV